MTARWKNLARALATGIKLEHELDAEWRRALAETPRHVFVPRFIDTTNGGLVIDGDDPAQREHWLEQVYADTNLITQARAAGPDGAGAQRATSSSSMPSIMAWMLQALDVSDGHRVLEIGTGTGYNAALLAHRLGDTNVASVDIDPELVSAAREHLHTVGYAPTLAAGDGADGFPDKAPYDAILATAAVDHIPPAWIEQLRPGGVVVADLRGGFSGAMITLRKIDDDTVQGHCHTLDAAFMPLRQDLRYPLRYGPAAPLIMDRRNPQRGTTSTDVRLVAEVPALRFTAELQLGVTRSDVFVSGGEVVVATADGSWAAANLTAEQDGRHTVAQGGPRRLWDSVEAAVTTWHDAGRPTVDAFGVTASTEKGAQRVWLHDPDSALSWPLPG